MAYHIRVQCLSVSALLVIVDVYKADYPMRGFIPQGVTDNRNPDEHKYLFVFVREQDPMTLVSTVVDWGGGGVCVFAWHNGLCMHSVAFGFSFGLSLSPPHSSLPTLPHLVRRWGAECGEEGERWIWKHIPRFSKVLKIVTFNKRTCRNAGVCAPSG